MLGSPKTTLLSALVDGNAGMSHSHRVAKFTIGCGMVFALSCGSASAETRGVVELFTSQGCSSCPPADKVIGELAADSSLVVMSLPVDYWDYLGWKDTLASPDNTARQRAYSHVRGDRQVYTPQVVVNGSVHVLGSDKAAIQSAVASTRKNGAMSVAVTMTRNGNELVVSVPAAGKDKSGEVWLCGMTRAIPVEIGRGENHGRSITYFNVARQRTKLGDLDGEAHTWRVPVSTASAQESDEAAVLVQAGSSDNPGAMLGAAFASLH
jgi:hypothetical protein